MSVKEFLIFFSEFYFQDFEFPGIMYFFFFFFWIIISSLPTDPEDVQKVVREHYGNCKDKVSQPKWKKLILQKVCITKKHPTLNK